MKIASMHCAGLAAVVFVSSATAPVFAAGTALDLFSPLIVHSSQAGTMEQLAARELWRCLAEVSGKPGAIAADDAAQFDRAAIVLLDVAGNNRLAAEIEKREEKSRSTQRRSETTVSDGRRCNAKASRLC